MKNQRWAIGEFCLARGLANVEFVEEIGGALFRPQEILRLHRRDRIGAVGILKARGVRSRCLRPKPGEIQGWR